MAATTQSPGPHGERRGAQGPAGTLLWAWLDALAEAHGGYPLLVRAARLELALAIRLARRQLPQPVTLARLLQFAGISNEQARPLFLDAHQARSAAVRAGRRRKVP